MSLILKLFSLVIPAQDQIENDKKPSPETAPALKTSFAVAEERHDSDSDYEDNSAWSESWGDMDVRGDTIPAGEDIDSNMKSSVSGDGWDTGWDEADFAPINDPGVKPMTSYNWEQKSSNAERGKVGWWC